MAIHHKWVTLETYGHIYRALMHATKSFILRFCYVCLFEVDDWTGGLFNIMFFYVWVLFILKNLMKAKVVQIASFFVYIDQMKVFLYCYVRLLQLSHLVFHNSPSSTMLIDCTMVQNTCSVLLLKTNRNRSQVQYRLKTCSWWMDDHIALSWMPCFYSFII